MGVDRFGHAGLDAADASRLIERIDPKKDVDGEVVFRVSDVNGIVDSNDLSGEPVYITVKTNSPRCLMSCNCNSNFDFRFMSYYKSRSILLFL